MRLVLQELIEAEATEAIGAGRYERSDARVNERNGHRPRLLATQAGDVELRIPKLRKGVVVAVGARASPAHRPGAARGHQRSNADHASWGSSPTKHPPSASSERSSPTSTTNGKPPSAATSQSTPWATLCPRARYHRHSRAHTRQLTPRLNPQSPPLHGTPPFVPMASPA